MRLIMAISADGFVARDNRDCMGWTGQRDKWAFRLLTSVGGRCIAGRVTANLLPTLPGRTVQAISSKGMILEEAYFRHGFHDAWLLGGQTLAISAFENSFIDEAFLCYSEVRIEEGITQLIEPWARLMNHASTIRLSGLRIEIYRR